MYNIPLTRFFVIPLLLFFLINTASYLECGAKSRWRKSGRGQTLAYRSIDRKGSRELIEGEEGRIFGNGIAEV